MTPAAEKTKEDTKSARNYSACDVHVLLDNMQEEYPQIKLRLFLKVQAVQMFGHSKSFVHGISDRKMLISQPINDAEQHENDGEEDTGPNVNSSSVEFG